MARGHVAAAERGRPGGRYRLGGENHPQMRVFELVRELTGRALPRRLPAWMAVGVGTIEEFRAGLTGRPPLLTAGTVKILTQDWAMDSGAAVDELGYRIAPLEDGMARVVAQAVRADDDQPGRGGA